MYCSAQSQFFAMQYDMSITNETQHQPEPEPIPAAAPTRPTTVTQRRPSQFDQGSSNYNGVSSGPYPGTGQYNGAAAGAGQYTGPGQYAGAGVGVGSGQYTGSGQFNAVSQPAYSGSPRFSSTPVDWSTATTSATPAAGAFSSQQTGTCTYTYQAYTVSAECYRPAHAKRWCCLVGVCP